MYSIVGQAIYLTRGDTMPISLSIDYMSGLKYIPDDKDTILFTVKRDFADTEPTIQKRMIITKVPGSTCVEIRTKIFPTDTKDLDAGYYVYDVQLTTRFGDVFTIVTPHTFRIMEEVSKIMSGRCFTPQVGNNCGCGDNIVGTFPGAGCGSGYSAYEIAVLHGFKGTEEEWLKTLAQKEVTYLSYGELPNLGTPNTIYIVTGQNAVFRWDEKNLKYYCIGRDYNDIDVINGGNANG